MTPTLIALLLWFGIMTMLVGASRLFRRDAPLAPSQTKELESTAEPLACEALVQRVFEQRLVDAGIMEAHEMTVCESTECSDCAPTRQMKCAVADCNNHGTKVWYNSPFISNPEMICDACYNIMSAQREVRRAAIEKKDKPLVVGGQEIPRPQGVPKHAAVEVIPPDVLERGNHYIVKWLWIDKRTSRQKQYVSRVADLSGLSNTYAMYSDESEKPIVDWRTRKERIEEIRSIGYLRPPNDSKIKATGAPTPTKRFPKPKSITFDTAFSRKHNLRCLCDGCGGRRLHPVY